jgi:5-methylcytosine-specific restriction protein A
MPRKAPTYKPPHARGAIRQWRNQCYEKQRGTASQRGYGGNWQAYRKLFLANNPLCVECDRPEPATDVDHIVPVSGSDDPLFWDSENHQALCHSCHSRKTMREMRRKHGNTP